MKTARWIVMAWSSSTVLVLTYYSLRWLLEPENPLRAELLIGVSTAVVAGGVAWIILPVFVWLAPGASLLEKWALSTPSIVATLCLITLTTKGGL